VILIALLIVWGIVSYQIYFVKSSEPDLIITADIVTVIIFGLPALVALFFYIRFRKQVLACKSKIKDLQQANLSMEQQNSMDTKIGDYIVCPHCAAPSDFVVLKSPPPAEGLRHCLKCGQQFFTSALNSYPVLFKK